MAIFRDGKLNRKELINHIHKALYAMDAEEAEDEFVDADQDGDDRIIWNEYVEEFYGLNVGDQNNILSMDTDTGTEFNRMYARDKGTLLDFLLVLFLQLILLIIIIYLILTNNLIEFEITMYDYVGTVRRNMYDLSCMSNVRHQKARINKPYMNQCQ